jgi:DNA excision repair protein ERCC-5
MGVTGLWTVVAPTARPTQLATLNRKRLAVDASIWIYQFLKAVRDKEGNALRNSHVVGFFRRICKLLYFGIKPVFVFDGGAPILKRETVRGRARRREGRREDAVRTAGKLLGMQLQRAAEEEEKRRRTERERTPEEELPPDSEILYVDEIGMSTKERQQNRQFKKKDQYHLPDLDVSIESMGAPDDPRIMSQAELEEYARQFHSGEDINLYDFSKIDFESPFFLSLPPSDRYNILNAARLRSRLRMGYSKEQLDDMFPDRMAFSRFQIERVRERNELTQRLMHVNGMAEDFLGQGGRIAGEKGKEYVLVKNEGVEGGWALGVVSNRGGHQATAIDLDEEIKEESDEDPREDEDFEDVAIEGLNRLPRKWARHRKEIDCNPDYKNAAEEIAQKRKAIYEARQQAAARRPVQEDSNLEAESDELFVAQDQSDKEVDELFEDVDMDRSLEEQDDLQIAIQMSLHKPEDDVSSAVDSGLDLFTTENRDNGRLVAKDANQRARQAMNEVSSIKNNEGEEDSSAFDLQAALAESRKSKRQTKSRTDNKPPPIIIGEKKFDGPLPFESLNLGQSLLGKKKADKIEQDQAGGFEKHIDQRTKSTPLPLWFAPKDWTSNVRGSDVEEKDDDDHVTYGPEDVDRREALMRRETQEVIDVDEASQPGSIVQILIQSDNKEDTQRADVHDQDIERHDGIVSERSTESNTKEPTFVTTREGASPPSSALGYEVVIKEPSLQPPSLLNSATEASPGVDQTEFFSSDDKEQTYWSETDEEANETKILERNADENEVAKADDANDDFEDVLIPPTAAPPLLREFTSGLNAADIGMTDQFLVPDEDVENPGQVKIDVTGNNEDDFSDSDEELMRQMAIEAEEHARFTLTLNNRSQAEITRDYDKDLKQLRNQQKKDRRDADEVTQIMVQECQALLRLFGLPYITAPMEAEAQCAELVKLGLVDGIVTDDSDIFLFGGTRVYKNMFNAAKFVECYLTTDLEKEYGLDRKKLIRFAHLLGSDYTEGVPGVGPVTAMEILTDFENLEDFRDWSAKIQMGQLEGNITTQFRKKFKRQAQKMFLPPSFPDTRVDLAYLHPDVDSDPSGFEWGVPDLDALRSYLMATIGWTQERTDEVLVPVIRDMNMRGMEGTQSNITRFFGGGVGVGGREAGAPRNRALKSGRMEKAFGRLKNVAENNRAQHGVVEEFEPEEDTLTANVRRRKAKSSDELEKSSNAGGDIVTNHVSRRKRTKIQAVAVTEGL